MKRSWIALSKLSVSGRTVQRKNFRQTAEWNLHISASKVDIEKWIREVLDKLY